MSSPFRTAAPRFSRRLLLLLPAALTMGCRTAAPPTSPGGAPAAPAPFVERATAAGIDFLQRTGAKEVVDIVQTSTGGVGLLDYDQDGKLDVYLVQGEHTPDAGGGNRLYRNLGDGTFEDVTQRAGVRGRGYGMGCTVGDFDGDGRPDLYLCNNGSNQLYRNRGDGTFEDVTRRLGVEATGCSIGAVFADLDGDRRPDLYVARYIRLTPQSRMLCSTNNVPVSCDPQSYAAQAGVFFHNDDGRRFVERTVPAGMVDEGRGMTPLVADLNEDQRPDLFVTNDTSANALFLNQGKGRFQSAAALAGVGYGELGVAEANMGCDAGDYDGDGKLDLFVGVMQDRSSLLFHNDGSGLFTLTTRKSGLAEATAPVVTWGVGFLDFDLDGDLDLFQSNGHVNTLAERLNANHRYLQPRQLFENDGQGRFTDTGGRGGPALQAPAAGRGAAFGDLDNDGDVDVVVNNLDGPPSVLFNQAEKLGRHWLRVSLRGKGPDTSPEGTLVQLQVGGKSMTRHLHTAYSYASANDPRLHFGLGAATAAGPLTVRWPDGTQQEVPVPAIDQELVVEQR
jgi:hypothetical protein